MSENPTSGSNPDPGTTPPPAYGAPPPYGTEPPTYGSQPPQYNAPPPAAPPAYGAPPAYNPPPAGYPQQPGYGAAGAPVSDSDRRTWSMLAHLGGIVLGFIAPLVVWAIYKDRDEFIKDQSTEALNFQITMTIGYVISSVLTAVFIGFLTWTVLLVVNLVFCIIGGMAANRGERYRYPFALRLVK